MLVEQKSSARAERNKAENLLMLFLRLLKRATISLLQANNPSIQVFSRKTAILGGLEGSEEGMGRKTLIRNDLRAWVFLAGLAGSLPRRSPE